MSNKGLRSPRALLSRWARERIPEWVRQGTGGKNLSRHRRWLRIMLRNSQPGRRLGREARLRRRERRLWSATQVAFAFVFGVIASFWWKISWLPTGHLENGYTALWRIAVILGAGLTAVSVMWRGTTATRQAESQRAAIDRQTQQIELTRLQQEAADEERSIELLQKGAELLATSDTAKVSAGIMTLGLVAHGRSNEHALLAMGLLAEYLEHTAKMGTDYRFYDVENILTRSENSFQRVAPKAITLEASNQADPSKLVYWSIVGGVERVKYEGGIMLHKSIMLGEKTIHRFHSTGFRSSSVRIENESVERSPVFRECRFSRCTIRIESHSSTKQLFRNCDFAFGSIHFPSKVSAMAFKRGQNKCRIDQKPEMSLGSRMISADEFLTIVD